MIEAKKSKWFEELFAIYNRNLLKRRFNSLQILNLKELQQTKQPQIIFVNHSSWWDGLIAFEVSRAAKLNSFIMMEEKNLQKYFLFRRLGAFSVNKSSLRDLSQTILYASSLLRNKKPQTLWIFPQGEIQSSKLRPITFNSGVIKILEKVENCQLLPLCINYHFAGNFKPEIAVKIGRKIVTENLRLDNRKTAAAELSEILTNLIDSLNEEIAAGDLQSYENILT